MRALTISNHSLEVREIETPEPKLHDVIVEVHAAGINAADLMQRDGVYPPPEGWPVDIPGLELAGIVAAVGDEVDRNLLGRRVCAIVGGGAQANYCAMPSEHLLFIPDDVAFEEAGGFSEAFTTAFDALVTQGQLEAGQRVLVSGAAGGVGVAGVQIARALGAEVIAVTRTDEHHGRLRQLGSHETITVDEVASIAGVDVVLELLGSPHFNIVQNVLNPMARVVVIGVGAGRIAEFDLRSMMGKRATITGSTLRRRSREEKAKIARRISDVIIPMWVSREIEVPLAKVFNLDEATEAYEFFAMSGKFGKVVFSVET